MMTNIESQKLNDENLEIVTGGKTFIVTVLKDMIIRFQKDPKTIDIPVIMNTQVLTNISTKSAI